VLAQLGDEARILAGGQSLMAVLNMRLAQPQRLLDISRSKALAELRVDGAMLHVGAAVTQATLEWRPGLAQELPLLALAFPHISHFQIRNRGTVAGSIAHADPSAELPLVLLAARRRGLLRSARGARRVAAQDFFTGMLLTARRADELVEAVRFPLASAGPGPRLRGVLGAPWRLRHLRRGGGGRCAQAAHRRRRCRRPARWRVICRCSTAPRSTTPSTTSPGQLDARDEPQASAALRRQLVRQPRPPRCRSQALPHHPETPA
jgi:2-furoyl-CoA dehydrogenase FAD binding subunit